MCGIVGYIGDKEAQPILLSGLKRLEYRRYDSSGMCTLLENKGILSVRKLPGKIKKLEQLLATRPLSGSLGIGHCLTPDTLILLADGRIIPISEVAEGQQVFSFNLRSQKLEPARVKVTKHESPAYLYNLGTSFGSLRCSGQHKIFVMSKEKIIEKKAEDLKKGDMLIIPKNIEIKEQKIQFKPIFVKRYFKATQEASQLIKGRLQKLQLTKTACASSSGISDSYMDHIFRNDRNFREDELRKLLPFLAVEFNQNYFTDFLILLNGNILWIVFSLVLRASATSVLLNPAFASSMAMSISNFLVSSLNCFSPIFNHLSLFRCHGRY